MTNLENKDSVSVESENVTADVAEKFTWENVEKAMKEWEGSPFKPEFKKLWDVKKVSESDINNWMKMVEWKFGSKEIDAGFRKFLRFPETLSKKGQELIQKSKFGKEYMAFVEKINKLSNEGKEFTDEEKKLLFELDLLMVEWFLVSNNQGKYLNAFVNSGETLDEDTKHKLYETEDTIVNNIYVIIRKMEKIGDEFAESYIKKYGGSPIKLEITENDRKDANNDRKNTNNDRKNTKNDRKKSN